jgi:hypothetical protein
VVEADVAGGVMGFAEVALVAGGVHRVGEGVAVGGVVVGGDDGGCGVVDRGGGEPKASLGVGNEPGEVVAVLGGECEACVGVVASCGFGGEGGGAAGLGGGDLQPTGQVQRQRVVAAVFGKCGEADAVGCVGVGDGGAVLTSRSWWL